MANFLKFLAHAAPEIAGARRNQLDRRAAGEERARKRTLEDLVRGQQTEAHNAAMASRRLDDLLKQADLDARNRPKAVTPGQRDYDPMRGAIVDKVTGEVIKPEGLPERSDPLSGLQEVTGPEGRSIYVRARDAIGRESPSPSGMGSASIKTKVASNRQQLSVIDDALNELKVYPGAVGLTRGLPVIGDRLDPRNDPKGVAARASIANIGSLKIHDRSGAAVSVHEFPRLAPFIPAIYDPPEAIKVKLAKLREAIELETQELERSGTVAPRGSGIDPQAIIKKYQLDQE